MKAGRKPKTINWDDFDRLCALQCTIAEICSHCKVDRKTLKNIVKREKGIDFTEYFDQKKGVGKIALRKYQWEQAKTNPGMAIFLGKNYLEQSDRQELLGKDGGPIKIKVVYEPKPMPAIEKNEA